MTGVERSAMRLAHCATVGPVGLGAVEYVELAGVLGCTGEPLVVAVPAVHAASSIPAAVKAATRHMCPPDLHG
jgi:hypothetical protein